MKAIEIKNPKAIRIFDRYIEDKVTSINFASKARIDGDITEAAFCRIVKEHLDEMVEHVINMTR
jgi:hypothetical protein